MRPAAITVYRTAGIRPPPDEHAHDDGPPCGTGPSARRDDLDLGAVAYDAHHASEAPRFAASDHARAPSHARVQQLAYALIIAGMIAAFLLGFRSHP